MRYRVCGAAITRHDHVTHPTVDTVPVRAVVDIERCECVVWTKLERTAKNEKCGHYLDRHYVYPQQTKVSNQPCSDPVVARSDKLHTTCEAQNDFVRPE